MQEIKDMIKEGIDCKEKFLDQKTNIKQAADAIVNSLKAGNKILICGNGGSAADAQHIAAELVGRYKLERKALPAIALTTDTSIITAWSNDYNFDTIFERQVEALANKGDILIALSTSGNSENIINAISKAKEKGLTIISLTGKDGGKIKPISDININSSSKNTPRIQECHMLAYHIICELVEKEIVS
jgi:D-sedoheptulose 7-phosphate isomerase